MNEPDGGWTVETLRVHTGELLDSWERVLSERDARYMEMFQASTVMIREQLIAMDDAIKERDVRYEQRFIAQETAMGAALASTQDAIVKADQSNEKRFAAQEKAVEVAFQSSKEAITKSEVAVEKRSDAVYVTLAKLSDALGVVIPRAESEQRFFAINEKIDSNNATLVEKIDGLRSREEHRAGTGSGLKEGWGYLVGAVGLAATVIAVVIALTQ